MQSVAHIRPYTTGLVNIARICRLPPEPQAIIVDLDASDVMTRRFCVTLDELFFSGYMFRTFTDVDDVVQVPLKGVCMSWQVDQDTWEWPFLAYFPDMHRAILLESPVERPSTVERPTAFFDFLEVESAHKVSVHLLISDNRNQKGHSADRRSS